MITLVNSYNTVKFIELNSMISIALTKVVE